MRQAFTKEHVIRARQELARRDVCGFACLVDIPTVPLSDEDGADEFSVMKLGKLAAHHELILRKLQGVEDGSVPNLMLLLPPGSAKSTYADVVFVPWYMARRGRRNVILASYASDIAAKQGRRARTLVKSPTFERLMGVSLSNTTSAVDQWAMSNGSEFMAGGILSGLTGNRAHLGIIDDPMRGREQAESQTIRDKTWDAYLDDFCSRLIPGAPQIMILCMTGDTPVLMESGETKRLADVRPGDIVVSYRDGAVVAAPVVDMVPQGNDFVFKITTKSGRVVRGNGRHPFLVHEGGDVKWVKLRDLNLGDRLVGLKGIGGSGGEFPARKMDVDVPQRLGGCAAPTTTRPCGPAAIAPNQSRLRTDETQSSSIGMGSRQPTTTGCWGSKVGAALSANAFRGKTAQGTGMGSSALTIAMTPVSSEGSYVTIVTSQSGTGRQSRFSLPQLNTYELEGDEIVSIEPDGVDEVYDLQVGGSENFIANGLVSHNTRWHQDDLAGRILPDDWAGESGVFDGRDGREWHVICLPAIADREDDPLGRKIGETLWPEWFSLDHWKPFQKNHRTWSSLYQQKPTPEDGTFFKREWFKRYKPGDIPKRLRKYGTSDYAVTEGGGDYTVLRVWGVDAEGGIWLLPGGYKRKETPDKWFEAQIDLQAHHKPFAWFGEAGVIQKSTEPGLKRRMRERKVHARLEWLPSISDKPTRARGAQARAAMGMVYIPEGPEGDALLAEYLAFPAGRHDDDVDNLSLIGRALDMAHPAIVPVDEKDDNNRPKDIYSRARSFGDSDGGGFYG